MKIPSKFSPGDYEGKWQEWWEKNQIYRTPEINFKSVKHYVLDMFPYPSATGLHVGHPEGYTATDIVARFKRMKGELVLHPMGWDAFGLPAENFAIKQGVHPEETTKKSIATFKKQIKSLGLSYDWENELSTASPEYYKWTQWLFEFMFKEGLAYQKFAPANWCSSCQTVLANEQVVAGKCERCQAQVIQKEINQWFFKITDFAEDLLSDLDKIDWPESTKTGQRNWIGKSEGVTIKFKIPRPEKPKYQDPKIPRSQEISKIYLKSKIENLNSGENYLEVFTTRPDTIYGVTYLVLAPEHPMLPGFINPDNMRQVKEYQLKTKSKTNLERTDLNKDKTGVFTGSYAVHPFTGESIPIFIADYVVMTYGTGAVMGVPAHDSRDFDFARKNHLPIKVVNVNSSLYQELTNENAGNAGKDDQSEKLMKLRELINANDKFLFPQQAKEIDSRNQELIEQMSSIGYHLPSESHCTVIASGKYSGVESDDVILNISKDIESRGLGKITVQYKLRDWLISRQRYWGSPIPIIYCRECVKNQKTQKSKIQDPKIPKSQDSKNQNLAKFRIATIEGVEYAVHLVPEADLPVFLPKDVDFRPTGESPLQRSVQFHEVKCPKCGAKARRESDTMDTFVCSSWYFLAFPWWEKYVSLVETRHGASHDDNREQAQGVDLDDRAGVGETHISASLQNIFIKYKNEIANWLPVDLYVGGAEHTVLHLLYSRFVTKALKRAKLIDFDEPFLKLRHIGMILGLDGAKMSKSRGNVINPDEVVGAYGADTLRLYEMFMGPLADKKPWDTHGVEGCYRFLRRIYHLISTSDKELLAHENSRLWQITQELLRDVENDICAMKFNTAIAKMMTWINNASDEISKIKIPARQRFAAGDAGRPRFQVETQYIASHDENRKGVQGVGVDGRAGVGETHISASLQKTILDSFRVFLLVLAPFAPHLVEELWFELLSANSMNHYRSIHLQAWPKVDENALKTEKTLMFLVEVSGKIVEKISFQENDERYQKQSEVEKMALAMKKVQQRLNVVNGRDRSLPKNIKKVIFIPKKVD